MNGVIVHRANKELINRVIAEKRRRFNEVPTFRLSQVPGPISNEREESSNV